MLSEALVAPSVSRPKIHRLPYPAARRPVPVVSQKTTLIAMAALAGLTMIAYTADKLARREALPAPAAPDIPEAADMTAPVLPPAPAPGASRQLQTIVITGESEGIVGQMARIPAQNLQMNEIESVSGVDNRAATDLLGIINKY